MLRPGEHIVFDNNEQTRARGIDGREGIFKFMCAGGEAPVCVQIGNLTTFVRLIDVVKSGKDDIDLR